MQKIERFFELLSRFDNFYWEYFGLLILILGGVYFTIQSKFLQFRVLAHPAKYIKDLFDEENHAHDHGTHPLKLYFSSIGGMLGLGNVAAVTVAITVGGPGALFWLWVAALLGMVIKYIEIYLGIKYRIPHGRKGFDGGPMYYLEAAFDGKVISSIACLLLCIYGSELVQFLMVADTVTEVLHLDFNGRIIAVATLIIFVLYCSVGGITKHVAICSTLMPPFLVLYICMCCVVIFANGALVPEIIKTIFYSAFNGQAAVGGFAGSTMVIAAQNGIARMIYSGDIGVGYDSIIQSETRVKAPEKQAKMAIVSLAMDCIICTLSCLVILVTGIWKTGAKYHPSDLVMTAFKAYFSFAEEFMTIVICLAGITAIIGYLVVGIKCAKYLDQRFGQQIYLTYVISAFVASSFLSQEKLIMIMSIVSGLLLFLNLMGMVKLRREIKF